MIPGTELSEAGKTPGAVRARRIRILHIGKFYPPHKGGMETHLQALCGELTKSVDLQVLVASDDRHSSEEILDQVAVSRVSTPLTLASAPICPGMVWKIRRSAADIVHLHWPNPAALMAYLASGRQASLVVTYHSDIVRQRVLNAVFEPCLHFALSRSAAIITTSPNYSRTSPVLSRYLDRCHVIPLGIDLKDFNQIDSAGVTAIRERYGERLVLSIGRLVYYKGFEYLIRAMRDVAGKLLIIGDGPLRGVLQQLVSDLKLLDRVFLLGEIPASLRAYYQAADVFALASVARTEAFGIVQIEAMAAGIPVVNTWIDSGVPFVSLHQKTGLTVPPADTAALSAALNRLLDQTTLRKTFGEAARVRAHQEFSLQAMADRTLALYRTIMDGPRLSASRRTEKKGGEG